MTCFPPAIESSGESSSRSTALRHDLRQSETCHFTRALSCAPRILVLVVLCCLLSAACTAPEADSEEGTQGPRLADLRPVHNLVVVLSDTHRYDHAAPLAQGFHLTPHLELLAGRGIRFTDASTPIPISAPAYASLMTGLAPVEHGLLNNHQDLRQDLPVLAEHLRRRGYETAAVVGNTFCSARHGFNRGFDHFWDDVEGQGKSGERLTDEVLRWLRQRDPSRPFFLFVAYMDAHTPYVLPSSPPSLLLEKDDLPWRTLVAEDAHRQHSIEVEVPPGTQRWRLSYLDATGRARRPPGDASPLYLVDLAVQPAELTVSSRGLEPAPDNPRFRQMDHRVTLELHNPTAATLHGSLRFRIYRRYGPAETPQLYADGVRHVDQQVGRLMAYLHAEELEPDTALVFVSDHGEMLGEHDAWGHVDQLWQESLQVPLIVKAPGLARGVTFDQPFDLMDLHWLLRVLAGERPAGSSQRFPYLPTPEDTPRYAFTFPPESPELKVAVRHGPLKMVLQADAEPRLYDLSTTAAEGLDLFAQQRQTTPARRLLALARQQLVAAAEGERLDVQQLSGEEIDRLKTLGYLD